MGGSPSTLNPIMPVRSPADGDGEFELLIFDEVAVRDGFAAAGKDTVFGRAALPWELRDVDARSRSA